MKVVSELAISRNVWKISVLYEERILHCKRFNVHRSTEDDASHQLLYSFPIDSNLISNWIFLLLLIFPSLFGAHRTFKRCGSACGIQLKEACVFVVLLIHERKNTNKHFGLPSPMNESSCLCCARVNLSCGFW